MGDQHRVRVLEAGFATKVDALMQALWDSSASAALLNKKWQETMAIRTQLIPSVGGVGGPALGGALRGAGPQEPPNWKSLLIQYYSKGKKEQPVLTYTTGDAPEALKPGQGPYMSQVTSPSFRTIYQGEPEMTKKKAEHAVAQQAFRHEFPAEYAALNSGAPCPPSSAPPMSRKGLPTAGKGTAGVVFAPPNKKRKVAEAGSGDPHFGLDARGRFQQAAQLLLHRCLIKGDVVFDCQPVESTGQFVSSVSLPAYDPTLAYVGEACATIKLAENAACEALLNSDLSGVIAGLVAEHQEKKAQKIADGFAKLKARHGDDEGGKGSFFGKGAK